MEKKKPSDLPRRMDYDEFMKETFFPEVLRQAKWEYRKAWIAGRWFRIWTTVACLFLRHKRVEKARYADFVRYQCTQCEREWIVKDGFGFFVPWNDEFEELVDMWEDGTPDAGEV